MIRENLNERCYKICETVFAGITYTKLGNNWKNEETKWHELQQSGKILLASNFGEKRERTDDTELENNKESDVPKRIARPRQTVNWLRHRDWTQAKPDI